MHQLVIDPQSKSDNLSARLSESQSLIETASQLCHSAVIRLFCLSISPLTKTSHQLWKVDPGLHIALIGAVASM